MAKNINVAAHLKRYEQTELSDVLQLATKLTEMVEARKESEILALEQKLSLLKKGEIPVEAPKPARPSRKKKTDSPAQPDPEA